MFELLLTAAIVGATLYYFLVIREKQQREACKKMKLESKNALASAHAATQKKPKITPPPASTTTSTAVTSSKKKDANHHHGKIAHRQIDHSLFSGSLKGFAGEITDYDFNEEFIVVASKDKHIRFFRIADLASGNINPPVWYYFLVEFGYPTTVGISADSRHIAFGLHIDNSIEVKSLDLSNSDVKKRSSPAKSFGKNCHKEAIINLSFDAHTKFLVSSATKSDTSVKVWSLSGKELLAFNTAQNQHYMARISKQRKYYLLASWTSSLRALTFNVDKTTHEFKGITKSFGLSHSASISYVSSDNLEKLAVTISANEKALKFWDTDVRIEMNQDPRLKKQFKGEAEQSVLFGKNSTAVAAAVHSIERVEGNHSISAATDGQSIAILDEEFNRIQFIDQAVTPEYSIHRLEFIQQGDGKLFLLSISYDECRINLFDLSQHI